MKTIPNKMCPGGLVRKPMSALLMLALGSAGAGSAVAQAANETVVATAPAGDEPSVVVISGLRASLENSRNKKRDGDAITDSIVAQDIGKLPDQNIAEAAQRIPGIQLQRYKEEGSGIAIRGLKQTKVVLNGLEVYGSSAHAGEYNGRNFDLQDLPAEVLAGVDVNKSSSADEIEGGLGGYVNIRTRQPFDFKDTQASLSVKETNFRMASGFGDKTRPQISALGSTRWKTAIGDMGVLLNLAHTEGAFGIAENELQRTQVVNNYAGSAENVTLPIGMFTGNGHHGTRTRDSLIGALQWRPSRDLNLYANLIGMRYAMRDDFQTARFYPGTPTSSYTLWGDRNADGTANLQSGSFSNSSLTGTSVFGDEDRKSRLFDVGGRWHDGGPWTIQARISRNLTKVENSLFEWGTAASIPDLRLVLNEGAASHVQVGGVDLTNRSIYRPEYLLAIHLDGDQSNTTSALDANYAFEDWPLARSLDFGLRASDYTRHSYGYINYYCIDACNSSRTLAAVDQGLLRQVPASESRDVGAYWAFSSAAVRQQSALRALYGLPARETNQLTQDQLNKERTVAAYAKLNYGFDVGRVPVTGNLGVRAIRTRLRGESYGADATGLPVLQTSDTTRDDYLPSLNAKLALREDLSLRLGASKTLGQVNFAYLSSAVNIANPVQKDAQAGNPNLAPYTSKNYDLSLEHYFSGNGMASAGLFSKTVDGFIQTVAEKRLINGEEYNVSTYQSSGTSKIRGLELNYQQFFDRLPAPFNGLGMQANYTYVDATAPSAVAGQTVPLEGLSRNSYNLVAMYEQDKLTLRLAYNWRGAFVVSTSSSGAQGVPVIAAPMGTLDFSLAYDFSKHLSVVLDGVNIAGAHAEQYYGSPRNPMNYLPLNKRYGVQLRFTL